MYEIVEGQQKINERITSERDQAQNECVKLIQEISCLEEDNSKKDKFIKGYEHVRKFTL